MIFSVPNFGYFNAAARHFCPNWRLTHIVADDWSNLPGSGSRGRRGSRISRSTRRRPNHSFGEKCRPTNRDMQRPGLGLETRYLFTKIDLRKQMGEVLIYVQISFIEFLKQGFFFAKVVSNCEMLNYNAECPSLFNSIRFAVFPCSGCSPINSCRRRRRFFSEKRKSAKGQNNAPKFSSTFISDL